MKTTEMPADIAPGDWVAFYREGRLIYSDVRYIRQTALRMEYCTSHGVVTEATILEVRKPPIVEKNTWHVIVT